jgi:hypothetical protein
MEATTVQKPVTQPKRPRPERTGPAPVTKGLKLEPKAKQMYLITDLSRSLVLRALRRLDLSQLDEREATERARLITRLEARQ